MGLLIDHIKKMREEANQVSVVSPVAGEAVQLTETTEPLFSSEALGKGIAIKPTSELACAPVNGKVTACMPHAVGVTTEQGVEVLVHIGVETVTLNGEGFKTLVSEGQQVSAGDPLTEFSREVIAAHNLEDTVFVVVTSTDSHADVIAAPDGTVEVGQGVVTVKLK